MWWTMSDEAFLWTMLGGLALIYGIGLAFVHVDNEELRKKAHTNPGLAIYRFPAYRWSVVLLCIVAGIGLLGVGLGLWAL